MYRFPWISNIDDVLPAIEGRKEFVVADRGDYKIINYNVMLPDTFPPVNVTGGSAKMREQRSKENALRRECRGIIFDAHTGHIIRRPLHKFFNLNENEEVQVHKLDFSQPHTIYDKLDGSMIAPFRVGDRLIWGTKMAAPDFHFAVATWVAKNPWYENWVLDWLDHDVTPIFEWTAPENRIVVEYKEPMLTLLAMRDMQTGEYLNHHELNQTAGGPLIPLANSYESVTDIDQFIEDTRISMDIEGYVAAWENGYRIKLKCDWYVQIHKAKELILKERNVLTMLLNNSIDDVMPFLPWEDRRRIEFYTRDVFEAINSWAAQMYETIKAVKKQYGDDRKAFALGIMPTFDPYQKALTFQFWDIWKGTETELKYQVYDSCLKILEKNITNNQNFREIKARAFDEVFYTPYDVVE